MSLKAGIGGGIGLGIGMALVAPIVLPIAGAILKPAAKAGLVCGITPYEKSKAGFAEIVASVKAETSGRKITKK